MPHRRAIPFLPKFPAQISAICLSVSLTHIASLTRSLKILEASVTNHIIAPQDENDDYCTSCGGSGELVCCDGCTRSFHLICVDPPLLQDSMPNEWFCNVCRSENQDPATLPVYKGAFRFLHEQADKKNSSAYSLPKHTRERFEGVRTGPDGEYEDIVPPAPKPSR